MVKDWSEKKVVGVCADGEPAILESKLCFQTKVKELAQANDIHCMNHRYALVSKALLASLQEVHDSVIKIVNYICVGGPLHPFVQRTLAMRPEFLLACTAVQCSASKVN